MHFCGRKRFIAAVGIDMEFGLRAVFLDGHFEREIAIAQHAATVGPAFIFVSAGTMGFALGLGMVGMSGIFAASGKQ
ncbi:putative 1-deoxy-D-xylulose-5-phosphate synthase [Novosphingobium sp. PY1]|nr:putative 1-deoxy-D-xylulose-5-phosphate synthase [Novosphingobium sp. PY1]